VGNPQGSSQEQHIRFNLSPNSNQPLVVNLLDVPPALPLRPAHPRRMRSLATGSREAKERSSAKHHRGMYSSSRGNALEANGSRRCSAPSGVSPGNMSAMMRTSAPSLRFIRIASFTR